MSKEQDADEEVTLVGDETLWSDKLGEAGNSKKGEQDGSGSMTPILKRSALPRTPPRRRSPSLPGEVERRLLIREEQDKRKRGDDSPKEGEGAGRAVKKPREAGVSQRKAETWDDATKVEVLNRVKGLVNKVDEEVANLYKITSSSRNTRVEIKDYTEKLIILMGELTNLDIGSVVEGLEARRPGTKEVGVQAELRGRLRSQKEGEGLEIMSLEGCDTLEKWKEMYKRKWHSDAYLRTAIREGEEIMETDDNTTKVVFVTRSGEKSTSKKAWEMFPELITAEEDFVVLEQTTKIRTSANKGVTRKLIRLTVDGSEGDMWEKLCRVREEVEGDDMVALQQPPGQPVGKIRKMLEGIFQHTLTKVFLHTDARERTAKKAQRKTTAEKRERDTCALVVESTKKENYTDILKRVKEGVKECTASNKIRGLRSTRDGRLLITMDKDAVSADRVQEIISELPGRLKITRAGQGRSEVTIHVRGMDALTTKQDVMEAVERKIGPLTGKDCKLSELRPNLGDTLAATLALSKEDASRILEAGFLRVGCVSCRVEKRVNMKRCFKCWSYTHRAKDCASEIDRSKTCFKCGENGHNVKECVNGEACPMCGEEGHMADTRKCRFFRKALALAKDIERGKTFDPITQRTPAARTAESGAVATTVRVEPESLLETSND